MNARIDPMTRIRLEKAAADCGFELAPELLEDTLTLRSAQFPETVRVRMLMEATFEVSSAFVPLIEAQGQQTLLLGYEELYEVLERASATARNLPNRIAFRYSQLTASMPKSTEAERLVVQRVGQDLFRSSLLDYWQGSCCITGLAIPELLRASHIKPWARCESDEERLDVFNGLLLAPHLDALFDDGWMTVDENSQVRLSPQLTPVALEQLGVPAEMEVANLSGAHFEYLFFHRSVVYRR